MCNELKAINGVARSEREMKPKLLLLDLEMPDIPIENDYKASKSRLLYRFHSERSNSSNDERGAFTQLEPEGM